MQLYPETYTEMLTTSNKSVFWPKVTFNTKAWKVEEMSQQWVVWEIFSLTTHQTGSPYIFREYKTPLISDLREGEIRDWDNNN